MRRCGQRGQTAIEYLGVLLVVVALVGTFATAAPGIGGRISCEIDGAIAQLGGGGAGGCGSDAAPRTTRATAPGPTAAARGQFPSRAQGGARLAARYARAGDPPRSLDGAVSATSGQPPAPRGLPDGVQLGAAGGRAPLPFAPPRADPGAGKYGSEDAGVRGRASKAKWRAAARAAEALGLTDAARHMNHYLDNTGKPMRIDTGKFLRDEPQLRRSVGNQVAAARRQALARYRGKGSADIPFRTSWALYTARGRNWFLGLGSVRHSVTGVVHIEPGKPPRTTFRYRVHVHDRYNWDGSKSTPIGPFVVTDKELGKLHRQGIAREYDVDGTSKEIRGDVTDAPSSAQPPSDGGRSGGRGDAGRTRD